jgi:asparagine synthase (glutamine-hydrolysing)
MCGIFFYKGKIISYGDLINSFMKIKHRGPDNSQIYIYNDMFFGFHRLAINDISDIGNQPMFFDDCILICNGEIYNHNMLNIKHDLQCRSKSDCETIIKLYTKYKNNYENINDLIHFLCNELEGEFAFIIYDKKKDTLIVARDRYGVRPLFFGCSENIIGFASELKALNDIFPENTVEQFLPSSFLIYEMKKSKYTYLTYNKIDINYDFNNNNIAEILPIIKHYFEKAVYDRCMSDVPICALLSGGLDSSLVCGVLTKFVKTPLHTFSIGLIGSPDIFYAQKVADFIKSIHHSIIVTKEEMLNSIEDVIKTIESYDITSVRASIPHYLISKYIKNNTDFKVIFSGEYSDELFSGYAYNKKATSATELHKETCRILQNICYFDSLRADRCISSQSLEARCPFSSTDLIKFVQSINPELRMSNDKIEKFLLRKAFEGFNIIPDDVLFRSKAAFSDAVSTTENSWHKIIQKHIDTIINDEEFKENASKFTTCTPQTKEAYYYRKIFSKYYKKNNIIPYFWLPKKEWCGDILDPSARELKD